MVKSLPCGTRVGSEYGVKNFVGVKRAKNPLKCSEEEQGQGDSDELCGPQSSCYRSAQKH